MEYHRLDAPQSAMYRNQFNAPLDAKALLGDQLDLRENVDWENAKYIGSAMSDASILLAVMTDDWEELALTFLDTNFIEWAIGNYSWPADNNHVTPYIGCNVDRMGHVPKG